MKYPNWLIPRHRTPHLPALLSLCLPFVSAGSDWPQYRGANHDGISTDRINPHWIGSVTNALWLVPLTNCIGSMTVSGGRLFTQTRRIINGADKEVCVALDINKGDELWAAAVDDASYPDGGVGYDDGPRSTPTVDGGSVYVLSSYLKLHCLNAADGSAKWRVDLVAEHGATVIGWQNAASPIVEDGLIFVNANSGPAALMALHTNDGSLAWRTQDEALTHSTPVIATIHGVRQVIFATQSSLVSLDPGSGNLLWKFPYPFSYSTSLGISPVVYDDMVFVGGAHTYGMGSVVVQIGVTNATWTTKQLWFSTSVAGHWMTPVAYKGFLFGPFGIQQFDSANAQLKCVNMRTGSVRWSVNGFGRGSTIVVDDHLVTITEQGQLVLSSPSTNAYTEEARCLAIPDYSDFSNKCWNSAAAADGRIYVRSTAYVAAFDFSLPNLKLDVPQFDSANTLRLPVRTANGAFADSNRLAGVEVRATTNLSQNLSQWLALTNNLVTNGAVIINGPGTQTQAQRFFILSEPK